MGKEKTQVIPVVSNHVLRKHGIFDFGTAYGAVQAWLNQQGYDFFEKKRAEKDTATGRYMELIWLAEKYVSDYVKYDMKIEVWMRDAKPVEGGKMQGRIEFIFTSKMHKNVDIRGVKKFSNEDKGTFMHFIKEVYEKYIARLTLEKLEKKLFNETMDFVNKIREAVG